MTFETGLVLRRGEMKPARTNTDYQRELAESLVLEIDSKTALGFAMEFGWEGVVQQIRCMTQDRSNESI